MCVKKQIIDGSACRSGCKSPFVFCDSKSTEMKIEMTNKKEAKENRKISPQCVMCSQ